MYQEKTAQIDVILLWDNEKKLFGIIKINLSEFANSNNNSIENFEKLSNILVFSENILLQKCPDKTATLKFNIKVKKIGEVSDLEKDT